MRSWNLVYILIATIGCASSVEDGSFADAALGAADAAVGFPDAPLSIPDARPDAFIRPDAAVLGGFNEPCRDRNECQTGICILSASGGYCSRLCNAGTCPEGFGCYGVLGLIEPGQVSYVCVKDTNLLCSPCTSGAECSATATDLCLPSESGGSFCARDCTTITCPAGYECETVNRDAGTAKQCVPASGACDCQADDSGTKKDCTITTPLGGACDGERTCLGAAGWGECQPPSMTDVPDGNFGDENCDGIDGDLDDGLFVVTAANGGEDNDSCGPRLNPCATITTGTRRAKLLGKKFVYVQAGTYNETVIMRDGVSVFGGYDVQWKRAPRSGVGHEVRIASQLYATDNQFVGVVAHDLTVETTIADVNIVGGNAAGSSGLSGRSSYGVHAAAAKLRLERITINAGKGADGAAGSVGLGASILYAEPGMNGIKGADGDGGFDVCSTASKPGGDPGENSCAGYTTGSPVAGHGGSGGSKDSTCPCVFGDCWNAKPGKPGDPATVTVPDQYGYGGAGGSGQGDCGTSGEGGDGRIINGDGGAGGKAGGRIVNRYWYSFPGQAGKLGQHGGGGGGGGGAGGCDKDTDSAGGGGGGAGAGGCAAREGGPPGEGGGGSFGVFAVDASTVVLRNVTIEQANAGKAGSGGTGGQGQSGGAGLPGGARGDDQSAAGGKGGDGGHGGHGGGGGGGAGGVSYGLFSQGGTTVDKDAASIINDGGVTGGGKGLGGSSAPDAPLPERDGKPGLPGVDGAAGKTYVCLNPEAC